MKKWKVEIKAQDEASALVYLEMLVSSFKAAVLMKLPMDTTILEDPDKGEKLSCTSLHNQNTMKKTTHVFVVICLVTILCWMSLVLISYLSNR